MMHVLPACGNTLCGRVLWNPDLKVDLRGGTRYFDLAEKLN
jgi:hypothetical protein